MFNDCVGSDASIERAIRRLNALILGASKRVQDFRVDPCLAERRVLMVRPGNELEISEDGLPVGLVAKSRNSDAAAMELLIEQYQPRVAGFVYARVGDGQAVEDLCQTIFYKMVLRLPCLKDDEKFEPWLFRIARNACFDYLRRRRLRRIFLPWKGGDDQIACAPEPIPESEDDRRIIAFRRALMTLPKKQRELVALLQDDRLSYEQLAEITNSNVGSVKSRLFRARRQLRKLMHEDR